ncbi:MAG: aldehyde dehydrogenase family protein [Acidimicrobiales bacterium]
MLSREYPNLYINGTWHTPDSKESMDVISPFTEEVIGHVPAASKTDIDAAVAAANHAFYETDWSTWPVAKRAALLRKLADKIAERKSEFSDLIVEEMGCTKLLSDLYQATAPSLHWNYAAEVGEHYPFSEVRVSNLSDLVSGSEGGGIVPFAGKSLVVKEPVGPVAVFCAYNFALACVGQKAGPALVAGCTVVVKTPEQDPLAIYAMGDLLSEVGFPPGVINIVSARAEESAYLVSHPQIAMVSFTGSDAVGEKVGEACGALIRPCVLELGGKSAGIILRDANLDQVLPVLVGASVATNAGQSCVCISRFLVPREMQGEIAARFVAAFESLKIGDPRNADTVIQPLISRAQRDKVLAFIKAGVDEGATLATGGAIPADYPVGWYVEPTLLTNVRSDMSVAQKEAFGPVVVMIPYDDEDDAIRIANDSPYGLSGCVFTSDVLHGFEVARRVRTGTFSINTFAADFNSPFGGYKRSGIGREHGITGLEGFLLTKTISIDPSLELPNEIVSGSAAVAPQLA